jgi:hypothetical protein
MKLDQYTRKARLEPALVAALSFGLIALALFPGSLKWWGTIWSFVVWSGGTALLSQIARDRGKLKEAELFEILDGKPTTNLLRVVGTACLPAAGAGTRNTTP